MKTIEYWKEQSEKFNTSADDYDQFRPGYPQELVETLLQKTNLSKGAEILEIGTGTGKATELFINRGFHIYCVEPGENLVKIAARKLGSSHQVEFYIGRFEEWKETLSQFDLAISAQAFHWIPKPLGFQKCANALKPEGHLGLFWNFYLTHNDPLDIELKKTGLLLLQSEESCENRIQSHIEEITTSGYFQNPDVFRFPWKQEYPAEDYIGFMKTGNAYLSLLENEKERAEQKMRSILHNYGEIVVRHYLCTLFIAQKTSQKK